MSKAAVNEGADAIVADSLADAVRTTVGEQAKLRPSDGAAGDYFGYSVSLSGNRALVGAVGDSDNGLESGAAYVFAFDGTTWNEQAKLTASDEETGDSFGTAVALLGTRALVGAIHNDSDGIGAAYFFDSNGTTWTERAKFSAADSTTGDYFGISVSLSGPRALVGANQGGLISGPPGTAYVFGR
jgi:hypothetical protein